jgi:predicted transcriptional regulator
MQTKELPSLYLQSPKLNQLNILREVAANAHITQAELASHCSLSVAMVNNYMKELCAGNMLEYHRKTTKSVTYHVTETGAQYLQNLQVELIHESVNMFAAAKERIRDRILGQAKTDLQRVVLYGSGDLAQLAFHALEMSGVRILGICADDPAVIGTEFCGREVLSPNQIRFLAPDAIIIADSNRTQEIRNFSNLSEKGINVICLDGCINQSNGSMTKSAAVVSTSRVNGDLTSLSFSHPNSSTGS